MRALTADKLELVSGGSQPIIMAASFPQRAPSERTRGPQGGSLALIFQPRPKTGHHQHLCYTKVMQKRVAVGGLPESGATVNKMV